MIRTVLILAIIAFQYCMSGDYDYICAEHEEDVAATEHCTKWPHCMYNHPNYCDSYVQCSADGVSYDMLCPGKEIWDDEAKSCEDETDEKPCTRKRKNNPAPARSDKN